MRPVSVPSKHFRYSCNENQKSHLCGATTQSLAPTCHHGACVSKNDNKTMDFTPSSRTINIIKTYLSHLGNRFWFCVLNRQLELGCEFRRVIIWTRKFDVILLLPEVNMILFFCQIFRKFTPTPRPFHSNENNKVWWSCWFN